MLHTRVAVALAVLALLSGCSSSNSGTSGTPGSSGSGSGSGGNGPSRATVTCAQAGTAATGGTVTAGSWGTIPTAFQQTPGGGTFCGTLTTGDGGGIAGSITIVLTSDWDQQIFDFYSPLAKAGACTLEAMTTTTGSLATSGTSYTCTNGGYGRIDASPDSNFLMLTYSASGL